MTKEEYIQFHNRISNKEHIDYLSAMMQGELHRAREVEEHDADLFKVMLNFVQAVSKVRLLLVSRNAANKLIEIDNHIREVENTVEVFWDKFNFKENSVARNL